MNLAEIRKLVRDVPDFPKPGILFKDFTPVFAHADAFQSTVQILAEKIAQTKAEKILGVEARGFILGAAIADRLKLGFIPIRKKGKLPFKSHRVDYGLEYGFDSLEIHSDALEKNERVALIDDVLATGGTAAASIELCNKLEAEVVGSFFLMELSFLSGRKKLPNGILIHSLFQV